MVDHLSLRAGFHIADATDVDFATSHELLAPRLAATAFLVLNRWFQDASNRSHDVYETLRRRNRLLSPKLPSARREPGSGTADVTEPV